LEFTAKAVRTARSRLNVSQSLFADFLGVSVSTVQDWEQGRRSPKDIACRMMEEILTNPSYWKKRFRELATVSQ
ncbi:MAG: helix-turn-helix domain-containing protein, partial [Planctomycetota bacterium]